MLFSLTLILVLMRKIKLSTLKTNYTTQTINKKYKILKIMHAISLETFPNNIIFSHYTFTQIKTTINQL